MDSIKINGKEFTIVRSSPVIEADGVKGKKFWQAHIVTNTNGYYTCSSSWKETKDGTSKVVWSEPFYAVPTNVGQTNYRHNFDQSGFEFDSMVLKQRDKREATRPLPMLANTFIHATEPKKSRSSKITYPAFVQPKYDGMRVLYDGTDAWSRGNKEIIPEVFAHLHFNTHGFIIDGELIHPDNLSVNEVMKLTKKFRPGESTQLVYRVYDIVDIEKPFAERFGLLQQIVRGCNEQVIISDTYQVYGVTDVILYHAKFVEQGFEGTIIRNAKGMYKPNKRVDDLQKYKDFVDGEYRIVDVIPSGGGSATEVGKFVCVDDKGEQFESTATGKLDQRKEYLSNKDYYIGKYAKVKYRELSGKNQVPFHSNVLEIRDTKTGGY